MSELDQIDRGILHILQEDARNHVASELADVLNIAPNTVRNRIERMEAGGVIQGYHPLIDYEAAGFQLHVVFICTVPISERADKAEQAMAVPGVIEVTEVLSGTNNLTVEVVATDGDDITQIAERLEGAGVTIQDERFLKNVRAQPYNPFGADIVGDE